MTILEPFRRLRLAATRSQDERALDFAARIDLTPTQTGITPGKNVVPALPTRDLPPIVERARQYPAAAKVIPFIRPRPGNRICQQCPSWETVKPATTTIHLHGASTLYVCDEHAHGWPLTVLPGGAQ